MREYAAFAAVVLDAPEGAWKEIYGRNNKY
jgi:hypothetical protein